MSQGSVTAAWTRGSRLRRGGEAGEGGGGKGGGEVGRGDSHLTVASDQGKGEGSP
jgi:hypothetical protein